MIIGSIARAAARRACSNVPDRAGGGGRRLIEALTKSDLHLRCLLEPSYEASEADIARNVDAAVAMFMSHYGPHPR